MPDQGGSITPAGRRAGAFRRRRTVGAHRADDGLSGSPGRYAAFVALLAGLASLPTWAVVQAGARALATGDGLLPPPSVDGSLVPVVVIPGDTAATGPTTPPGPADSVYQPAPVGGLGGAAWVEPLTQVRRVPPASARQVEAAPPPVGDTDESSDPPDEPSAPDPSPVPRQWGGTGGTGGGSKPHDPVHAGRGSGASRSQVGGGWSVRSVPPRPPVPPRRGGRRG
ncbi:MAG TPA: hypothetical protein VF054_18080 [Micromonosporaceae bacterium]